MRRDKLKHDFYRLYQELTDPEMIAENRRRAERKQRLADKRADTGL